ncbi:MAG: thiol peroxidase [Acidimicrobiales bacterium]
MATTKLGENTINTAGDLPEVGSQAPEFTLVAGDFSEVSLDDLAGRRIVLNIFPTVDTPVCSASVRHFNQLASSLDNTTVVCVSADLPISASRFCAAEGLENVTTASTFRSPAFGQAYGTTMADGAWAGLQARAVVVIGDDGKVLYTELVPAIGQEPDYDAAVASLS